MSILVGGILGFVVGGPLGGAAGAALGAAFASSSSSASVAPPPPEREAAPAADALEVEGIAAEIQRQGGVVKIKKDAARVIAEGLVDKGISKGVTLGLAAATAAVEAAFNAAVASSAAAAATSGGASAAGAAAAAAAASPALIAAAAVAALLGPAVLASLMPDSPLTLAAAINMAQGVGSGFRDAAIGLRDAILNINHWFDDATPAWLVDIESDCNGNRLCVARGVKSRLCPSGHCTKTLANGRVVGGGSPLTPMTPEEQADWIVESEAMARAAREQAERRMSDYPWEN